MQKTHTEFDGNELDWLAFRYVAGELTESEAAQFEERLAVDQLAREAVARNVELTSVLSISLSEAEKQSAPQAGSVITRLWGNLASRDVLSRSRWGLLATTAMLAILASRVLWHGVPQEGSSDESLTNAEQLVALWSEGAPVVAVPEVAPVAPGVGAEMERPAAEERRDELVADAGAEDLLQELFPEGDVGLGKGQAGDSNAVPDWMLAGVSLELTAEMRVPEKGAP